MNDTDSGRAFNRALIVIVGDWIVRSKLDLDGIITLYNGLLSKMNSYFDSKR